MQQAQHRLRCGHHCVPDLLLNGAFPHTFRLLSFLVFQAQRKLPLKLLNWWKELGKSVISISSEVMNEDVILLINTNAFQLITELGPETFLLSQAASLICSQTLFLFHWALNILQD